MWRPTPVLVCLILVTLPSGGAIDAQELVTRGPATAQDPVERQQAVARPVTPANPQQAGHGDENLGPGNSRCKLKVKSLQSSQRRRFSATEILDLDFRALFRGDFSGDHLLHLKIYTPNRHLYQTLTVPFSTSAARGGAHRQVDGFPRPLAIQSSEQVETADGPRVVVTARLPVAGTSIVHSSLYGRWRVEAFLDGAAVACRRRVFFIVQ